MDTDAEPVVDNVAGLSSHTEFPLDALYLPVTYAMQLLYYVSKPKPASHVRQVLLKAFFQEPVAQVIITLQTAALVTVLVFPFSQTVHVTPLPRLHKL